MKRIAFFVPLALSVCLTLSLIPSFAAPQRRGVQVVLLPHWSGQSVQNFLNVFRDSSGRYTKGPAEIEIAFTPYLFSPRTNYVNARTIIDALRGGGKRVYVTVHLSFHAAGNGKDAEIANNARDFNDNFLRQYASRATILVSPSLEDQGSDSDFNRWAGLVAARIDSGLIANVILRRSSLTSNTRPGNCFGGRCFRAGRTEFHGAINNRGDAYSNDGNFVYSPENGENSASLLADCGGGNPAPQYPLNGFLSQINRSNDNVVLLWRPAYNLLVKRNNTYTRCGRDLSDPQNAFGSVEQSVLKRFLGIP